MTIEPTSIALEYGSGEMEINGLLRKPAGTAAPDTVWVWAYFLNPQVTTSGSWSGEPVAVASPFGSGDTATVSVRTLFHWATNRSLPRTGYFARVRVSAGSAEDAQVPSAQRSYEIEEAIRVTSRTH